MFAAGTLQQIPMRHSSLNIVLKGIRDERNMFTHRAPPKTVLLTLGLGAAVALAPAAVALGAEPDRSQSATVIDSRALTPADGHIRSSGRHGAVMTMTRYFDGSVEVNGRRAMKASSFGVAYSIDTKNATYTAVSARASDSEHALRGGADTGGTVGVAALASRRVHIMLKDLLSIVVGQNYNELWWGFDFNTLWPNALSEWCSASAPTAVGTNWRVVSCNDGRGAWLWNANTRITNVSKGTYENFDFGNPALGTWCDASSTITGRQDGNGDVAWTYRCWGEYSGLLWADVSIS